LSETSPSDTEPEATDGETGRERRCIVTGAVGDPAHMVRFVVGPDETVWPDVGGKLPGRGMWVTSSRAALQEAIARKAFNRAAKRPVTVPPDLADRVEKLLRRRALDHLGLARGSGLVRAGFEKVHEKLQAGKVRVLVQARDGSPAQRQKLAVLTRGAALVELFSNAELSLALGRQNVIHAALSAGPLADRFLLEVARLAGFCVPVTTGGAAGTQGPDPILEIE
jgi:predicted RNA-binding protein YlxR (DUF448 family)